MGQKKVPTLNQKESSVEPIKSETDQKSTVAKNRVQKGLVYVQATFNNTIVTITDTAGNVLVWSSAGTAGFKGTKKSTPYAAAKISEIAIEKAKKFGLEEIKIFVKGIGSGRESAIRKLAQSGIQVSAIDDITPLPHNGCKPKKPRRI